MFEWGARQDGVMGGELDNLSVDTRRYLFILFLFFFAGLF